MIGFFKLLISRFIVSVICSKYLWNLLYRHTHSQVGTHTTYFSGSLAISEQAVSRIQTVSYSGFEKKLQNSFFHAGTQVFRQHRGASMGSQWAPILCSAVALMREYNLSRFIPCYCRNHILHIVTLTIELIRRFSASPGNNTFFAVCPISGPLCVCVYRYSKRFSFDESIMFRWSRGQRCPCHFLCQRSWVTCGKDIDQGRLIYVPAMVKTVDLLFLFMSCALFILWRFRFRCQTTDR